MNDIDKFLGECEVSCKYLKDTEEFECSEDLRKLIILCRAQHEALKAWQLADSEAADKHPCPDLTLRFHYREKARKLTLNLKTESL